MTQGQLAVIEALVPQYVTVWRKLGLELREEDLHILLWQANKTAVPRKKWRDYPPIECTAVVGHLIAMLDDYKEKWRVKWTTEKAQREATATEQAATVAASMTWEVAEQWVQEHHPYKKFPEVIEYVTTIAGVQYFKPREKRFRLLTLQEAIAVCNTYRIGPDHRRGEWERDKLDYFEPGTYAGYSGTLWHPLYES